MSPNARFASDNAGAVHPAVMAALNDANQGAALAYGDDTWTQQAASDLRALTGMPQATVLQCFGGTGANVLALRVLADRIDSVLCSDCAHLIQAETAAPQLTGGVQLVGVPSEGGKITPDGLRTALPGRLGIHRARPRVLSLTQATEWGTVYTLDELKALTDTAHELGLRVHVDGARLFHAAAALDCEVADMLGGIGVDAVSVGGTKSGLMCAEALVVADPALAETAGYHRKQITQLSSKMRFLSCQFSALCHDALWRDIAGTAHARALALADALTALPDVSLAQPVITNAVFARLPAEAARRVQRHYAVALWADEGQTAVLRFMTAFEVTQDEIDAVAQTVSQVLQGTDTVPDGPGWPN